MKPPTDFRIGDRLRLRKLHPCGGWTWEVVRLGADIGLVCETCGRRVLLDRPTLERRMKAWLSHGREPIVTPAAQSADDRTPTPELNIGDVVRPVRTVAVDVIYYTETSSSQGAARLSTEDDVRIATLPTDFSGDVLVEPVEHDRFEKTYVPGGIRSRVSYAGYAVSIPWRVLAREFIPVVGSDSTVEHSKNRESDNSPGSSEATS